MESAAGLANVQLYEYDTAGRLARIIARPKDSGERIAESYEYDAAGRKKKVVYVELTTQHHDTSYGWGVEGTDSIYSAPGAATLTTLYTERDQPAELLFCDAAGHLLSRVEFRYDAAGNLVEEAQTNVTETLPSEMLRSLNQAQLDTVRTVLGAGGESIRRVHSYDEQGRRVETRWRMGLLGDERKTVAYNDHDDPVEEVLEHDRREYGIDNEGRLSDTPTRSSVGRSQARFRYDYDTHSNWIRKTVECRGGPDQDFTLSSVEQRAIKYFE
jgi:YD repeat-containing protein